ncbi:MAG: hypothetical protein FJ303_20585 [Planctomycetes bacterium]|nr:hypothetical protein [Planctomycetota bacterium]
MSSMRCRQCEAPMTAEEMQAGTCPVCGVAIPRSESAATQPAMTKQADPPPPTLAYAVFWIAAAAVVFCLLPVGILSLMFLPEMLTSQRSETPSAQRSMLKPAPKKKDEEPPNADDAKKLIVKQAKPVEPEKKAEPKKEEKPKEIAKKQDEKKPVVEEKKPEQKPMLPVQWRGFANVPLVRDDAIKIDGELSDWKDIPAITLTPIERGRPTKPVVVAPENRKAKAHLAYCSKGILLAVDVVDTSGAIENGAKPATGAWAFWDNDGVEIFVDTLNTRAHQRGEPNAHQFFAFPFGTPGDMGTPGYESRIFRKNGREAWTIVALPSAGPDVMLRAGKKTATGWSMEMLIPKAELRHADLKPGQTLGFELQVDTGTNIFYHWVNDDPLVRISKKPSFWGEVMLAGTDAVVELIGGDDKIAKFASIGQALTIRVTDFDRNLDATKKEQVTVTALSRSGDRKTIILNETGTNTGVFEGAIFPRSRPTTREDRFLMVVPGDVISIEYIDTMRGNGERNVLLRSNISIEKR